MKALTAAAHLLRVTTGSAGTVNVSGSAVDKTGTGPASYSFATRGPLIQTISTATTVTVIGGLASTETNCEDVVVSNVHASTSNLITIDRFDGTNATPEWKGTLLAGERVAMDEVGQWVYYGSDGVVKQYGTALQIALAAVGAANVSAAATDTLNIFGRKRAGQMHLKYIGPSGVAQTIQDKISENGWSAYLPNGGTTVGLNYGIAWTSGGTVSHPTPASTAPAIYNQQKRTRWANVVTTTNQVLGLRTATAEKRYWCGNAAGLGGWSFHARFAIGLWPAATVRLFVGLNDSNTGWVVSDTLTGNGCGFWHDTTEAATVLNFVTRNGTTATKAPFTLDAALAAGQAFDAYIWCAPNGGSIGYALIELNTGTVLVDTTTSTTIPLTTAFMGPELAMSNGTANITVTTSAFELSSHSCQSDN